MSELQRQINTDAQRYSRAAGLYRPTHLRDFRNTAITTPASQRLSTAYQDLPEHDPAAVPAFKKMAEETNRQFDFMTSSRSKGGMGLNVEVTKHDPYGGATKEGDYTNWDWSKIHGELHDDVSENNRIKVFSTATTGGHPLLSNDENDKFRAVHDVFGHLGTGRGVDHHGEEAAYQKHSQMFSPVARQAMATETRGQNAALRTQGEFQDQKVAILPSHMQSTQFARVGTSTDRAVASQEARRKSREQGI